jgi:hypothetical protein
MTGPRSYLGKYVKSDKSPEEIIGWYEQALAGRHPVINLKMCDDDMITKMIETEAQRQIDVMKRGEAVHANVVRMVRA